MAKPAITKRTTKAAALTYSELDTNFQNLADATLTLTAGTGGTQVTADLNGNITVVAGTNITLTGDNTSKTITINSTGGGVTNPMTADLNTNGFKIVNNVVNGNITLEPNGSGDVVVNADSLTLGDSAVGATITTNIAGVNSSNRGDLVLRTKDGEPKIIIENLEINGGATSQAGIILETGSSFGSSVRIGGSASGKLLQTTSGSLVITGGSGVDRQVAILGLVVQAGGRTDSTFQCPLIMQQDYLRLASMSTITRNAISAQNGMLIYNSTDLKIQGYANGVWVNLH